MIKENGDAESSNEPVWRTEEDGNTDTNCDSDPAARRAREFDWREQERADRTNRAGDFTDIPKKADPGGIATRLLRSKVEMLSETQARYHIVLRRKTEYEERIARLEEEIEEIRSQIQELISISTEGEADADVD